MYFFLFDVLGMDWLAGALDVISQSLAVPVLVILLILVVVSIVLLGGFIGEFISRRKVPVKLIRDLIYDINNASSIDGLNEVISDSDISFSQKNVLLEITSSKDLNASSREALACKLFENEEEKTLDQLRKTDIITRIGPTLGLMGTLIPMCPGLAALGAGDINALASSLTVAFNTTIVGIGSGALCYVIGKIRSGWYDKYLSDLDALIDAVLDYMN